MSEFEALCKEAERRGVSTGIGSYRHPLEIAHDVLAAFPQMTNTTWWSLAYSRKRKWWQWERPSVDDDGVGTFIACVIELSKRLPVPTPESEPKVTP